MASNRYCIDVANRGTAACKNCKQKLEKGIVRIAKIVPNPFTDAGGEMKNWHHVRCIFQALSRARATTKKIESPDDIEGWDDIDKEHHEEVLKCIDEFAVSGAKKPTPQKKPKKDSGNLPNTSIKATPSKPQGTSRKSPSPVRKHQPGKDDKFREFRRLCSKIADISSYKEKTATVSEFLEKGSTGKGFDGDLYLYVKMLLPAVEKKIYNVQSKQLVKLFSQIFNAEQDEMMEDLEQGDVAKTVGDFFEQSEDCPPVKKSSLTLQEVEEYLDQLSNVSKEEQQMNILKKVTKKCTTNDLMIFVRLIKHDLRINAGPKHILEALHPTAYQAFQASRDLNGVVKKFLKQKESGHLSQGLDIGASLMTPVLPMLAEACRSVEQAFKKCPNGLFVEIKYDGERVQVHKQGDDFNYFSRSLKPVMPHKVLHFKEYIPKAFPHGNDLILDSEILLVDNEGKPLPFGSLGAHKKQAFKDATVCLFVFDCLQLNDRNLMDSPLEKRRKVLRENMKEVKNHVMFSEQKFVQEPDQLRKMIKSVIDQGLEGLVIKDKLGIYEPGKRHWQKVKKDYLEKGAMADSADLVVLGAYYGTGQKGGKKSIFLMGCQNQNTKKWCTVTKVHGGHDDETLEKLQTELKMEKIGKNAMKVPSWMNINKSYVPDFIITDIEDAHVWEITGAEFSKSDSHTAAGISIRFPRVTRIRDDKTWKEATTLKELQNLYKQSKITSDLIGLRTSPTRDEINSDGDDNDNTDVDDDDEAERPKTKPKAKASPKPKARSRSRSPISKPKEKTKRQGKSRSSSRSPPRKIANTGGRQSDNDKESTDPNKSQNRSKLLDVFKGVRLFLPSTTKDFITLRRYFIAYDGTILEEFDKENATHLVTSRVIPDSKCSNLVAQVTEDWLWDSIKLQKTLPHHLYRPTSS